MPSCSPPARALRERVPRRWILHSCLQLLLSFGAEQRSDDFEDDLGSLAQALRAVRALRGKVAEERAQAAAAVSLADRLSVPKASSVAAPRNVVAGARILRKA